MSRDTVHIVTGLYCEPEAQPKGVNLKKSYPQVPGEASSNHFQDVYWRCVLVYFASSVKNNPDANHILCTNVDSLPRWGAFKTEKFLLDLGVKIINLPFTYQPPLGYCDTWKNTFYKFDIIKQLSQNCGLQDSCILLDSDCVWLNSAARIVSSLQNYGLITYEINYKPDRDINGLTRIEMQRIYEQLQGNSLTGLPSYYGAEIIAGSGQEIKKVAKEIDIVWELSLKRYTQGQATFYTEEQILSYIYYKLGYHAGTANPYIKRIWTSARLHNATQNDLELDIWHLPAEKIYGLKRLATEIRNPNSSFWNLTGQEFIRYVGRYLGIPNRTPLKYIWDLFDAKMLGLKKRLGLRG